MGLAFGAMFLGAFGLLVPVAGAVVQECIDVFAILNALRALRGDKQVRRDRAGERRRGTGSASSTGSSRRRSCGSGPSPTGSAR